MNRDGKFIWGGGLLLLLVASPQTLAFDPNAALQRERERQKAPVVREERAIYERHRNRSVGQENQDGTVTIGGLQWMRCRLGQTWDGNSCSGSPTAYRWSDASQLPGLLNREGGFAGQADWRLPTVAELASIRVCSTGRAQEVPRNWRALPINSFWRCGGDYSRPTLDVGMFPNWRNWPSSGYVWTSSQQGSDRRHVVGFGMQGDIANSSHSDRNYIVLVRSAR